MKYLITILAIICGISLLTLYFIWPERPLERSDIAATVNGHALNQKSLLATGSTASHHEESYKNLLDSAITRELLIQEAQRQKLDKKESFRNSLKNYYEESLIKTLLDRQHQQPVSVSEKDIDSYLALFGKTITFTRLPVHVPLKEDNSQQESSRIKSLQKSALFDDLADPLKWLLSGLRPGQQAKLFDTGNEQYAIRLDGINPAATMDAQTTTLPSRQQVEKILQSHKRQQQLNSWLYQLRDNASITIYKEETNP